MALQSGEIHSGGQVFDQDGYQIVKAILETATIELGTVELTVPANATAPTNVSSTALEASHVIKASAGTLLGVTGYNNKSSAQFIQLHNTTTVPADTAVPVVVITVPASSNFSIDFGTYGRRFATGISICNSSTAATKTVGSADCWFDAQFV